LSIVYTSDGVFERALYLPSSPNLVLIDPEVIANAPERYLSSGMFDALAKWYEGQAVLKGIPTPDAFTGAAVQLTEFLYRRMKQVGPAALKQVRSRRPGDELRDVIDLNIYLTGTIQGLGLYTLRGGAAHAVHNGLTAIAETHSFPHGFKVGYGIVVQHFLEKQPLEKILEAIAFLRLLGLEPRLSSLGVSPTDSNIRTVAEIAYHDEAMQKMPFRVEAGMVISAIGELEALMDEL
jgi:glycerol dehydrogenase